MIWIRNAGAGFLVRARQYHKNGLVKRHTKKSGACINKNNLLSLAFFGR